MINNFNLNRILETEYHIKFGVQSGIPLCCISFFITEWAEASGESQSEYRNDLERWGEVDGVRVEYIPCPNCIVQGKIVELKMCKFIPYEVIQSIRTPETITPIPEI